MIKTEIITINNVQFQKTWSDANYLVCKGTYPGRNYYF